MNPLNELRNFGQSVWYDNIRRDLITSGELKRMMDECAVTGVTSNPVIFEKAISGGAEYDPDIKRLIENGLSESEVLTELFTKDVRMAADILRPAYDASKGSDGYVSIEVRPSLAYDTEATVEEAMQLFGLVDRPNVMVKVPATKEGVPAIEELVYRGYNINVTLLFSVKRYEEVAAAYVRALERRLLEGKAVDGVFGVASFFISRVDTLVDNIIDEMSERAGSNDQKARLKELTGKVAVANAKLAYKLHSEVFGSERFRKLSDKGARAQKLLWGSTSTKDPRYSDIKYVTELIAEDTINTLPLQTITAFADHGRVAPTLEEGLDAAEKLIGSLKDIGIDYGHVTDTLEEQGVEGFRKGYDTLVKSIAGKIEEAARGVPARVEQSLTGFEAVVADVLEKFESEKFSERLWERDPTLWKRGAEDRKLIKNSLGWLAMPKVMGTHIATLEAFAKDVAGAGFKDVVLLGMGGSSLAPLVLARTFGPREGYPQLHVLDTTDPEAVKRVTDSINPAGTLFIVSSKSGSTIEPLSLFEYFYKRLAKDSGEEAGRNFVAITDPGTALEGFSRKYRFRRLFLNPPDIGGRFSALSFFGLVPAALMGVDIGRLLYYAERMEEAAQPCVRAVEDPGLRLGAALGALARNGRDKVTFVMSEEVSTFGLWIEQLVAESTGKEGKGIVPVTGEPLAGVDAYGDDRVFVHIGLGKEDPATAAALDTLMRAGHPVIKFILQDLYELGGEFFRWEVATAAAGAVLEINPFDQPDVELAKRLTMARLGEEGAGAEGKETAPGVIIDGEGIHAAFGKKTHDTLKKSPDFNGKDLKKAMKDFLGLVGKGDYIGLLAYFDPEDGEVQSVLTDLRTSLRDSTTAATQFGYGPRYLHSTGQLHKGEGKKGIFLILTHESPVDVEIPGSSFGFSRLELSQAYGDMEALDSRGLRVALLTLKDSSAASVRQAAELVTGALSALRV